MPLHSNKSFPKIPGQAALLKKQITEKDLLVFYHKESNTVLENYEDYTYLISIFNKPIWQCKYTGKENLTFKQAHELEQSVEISLVNRLSVDVRKEILNLNKKDTSIDKEEKKALIEKVIEDIYRFRKDEIVTYKSDKNSLFRKGLVIDLNSKETASVALTGRNSAKLNPKSEVYTIADFTLGSNFVIPSDFIKHEGLLSTSNRKQLRNTVTQWISNVKSNLNIYNVIKEGIPTQSNLKIVIPPINRAQLLANIKTSAEAMKSGKSSVPINLPKALPTDTKFIQFNPDSIKINDSFTKQPLNKLLYGSNSDASYYNDAYNRMQIQKMNSKLAIASTPQPLETNLVFVFKSGEKLNTSPNAAIGVPLQVVGKPKNGKKSNNIIGDEARKRLKSIEQEKEDLEVRLKSIIQEQADLKKFLDKEKSSLEKKRKKEADKEKKLELAKEEEAKQLEIKIRQEAIRQEKIRKAEELRQREFLRLQMEMERQRAYEASIVYPVEDLEILPKFVNSPRPQPTLLTVASPALFQKFIKLWSFIDQYSDDFGFPTKPLMNLEAALRKSFISKENTRYPVEQLVAQLLECIVAEGRVLSNLWIPEGINDLEYYQNGLTIKEIGDWQKAEQPITQDKFGLVLLGALKELFCVETLPHGQDIIKFLEQGGKTQDTELLKIHTDLVETNMKSNEKVDLSRKTRSANHKGAKVNYKEVPIDSPPPHDSSSLSSLSSKGDTKGVDGEPKEEVESEEAVLLRRKRLESDVQLAYYGLPFDWHVEILVFLIEMAAGTSQIRAIIDQNLAKKAELRRDRAELYQKRKANIDQIFQLNTELEPLQKAYRLFHDPEVDTKVNLGNGFAKIGSAEHSNQNTPQKQTLPNSAQPNNSEELPAMYLNTIEVDAVVIALVPTTRKGAMQLSSKISELVAKRNRFLDLNTKLDTKIENISKKIDGNDSSVNKFKPLGKDRFYNNYYFLEEERFGVPPGTSSVVEGPKLLVEVNFTDLSLAKFSGYPLGCIQQRKALCNDPPLLAQKEHTLPSYAYYTNRLQVNQVLKWLTDKGQRERKLRANLRLVSDQFSNSGLPSPTVTSASIQPPPPPTSSNSHTNYQPAQSDVEVVSNSNGTNPKQTFTIQSWLQGNTPVKPDSKFQNSTTQPEANSVHEVVELN